jgi:hypothetical protein
LFARARKKGCSVRDKSRDQLQPSRLAQIFFSFDESAAMIRKVGDKYVVFSEKGKRLSKPMSKEKAKKRLRQIEFFKHRG